MAEIGIEKKKPIWPWIILVLVILAILYFLFFTGDDDTENRDNENNTEQVEDTTSAWGTENRQTDTNDTVTGNYGQSVQGYLSHVGDKSRMGLDHEYTNTALIQLMNAVESKAQQENVDISTDMEEIRKRAEAITRDPTATNHADKIKDAGEKIVDALEKIQEENYPNLSQDIDELRNSVQEIDPSVLTLEQKEDVNSFFDKASDVLRNMRQ